MQFFDRPSRAKIALRGSSSRPPTSEQLLARAKQGRQQRAQQRAQRAAAEKLQAAYRRRVALKEIPRVLSEWTPGLESLELHVALRQLLFVAAYPSGRSSSSKAVAAARRVSRREDVLRTCTERLNDAIDTLKDCTYQSAEGDAGRNQDGQIGRAVQVLSDSVSGDDSRPLSQHMIVTSLEILLAYLSSTKASSEKFVNDLARTVLVLVECLSPVAIPYMVRSAIYCHFACALETCKTMTEACELLSKAVLSSAALLRSDGVSEIEANTLLRQFGFSLLSSRNSLALFPWKKHEVLVCEVLRAVSGSVDSNIIENVRLDVEQNISDLKVDQVIAMLVNVLELGEDVWSGRDRKFIWAYVAVLSTLIEALPKRILSAEHLDDDDEFSEDEGGNGDLLMRGTDRQTVGLMMKTLRIALKRIVSEDTVRMMLTAAVGDGRAAVVRVCQLFNFLTRKEKSLTSSFQNALAFWRTSGGGRKPHILNVLWNLCIAEDGGGGMTDASASVAQHQLRKDAAPILLVFASAYSYLLYIQDVDEMFETGWPFSVDEVREIVLTLKPYLFHALYVKPVSIVSSSNNSITEIVMQQEPRFIEEISRLLSQLYVCDSRRQFRTGDDFWQAGRGALSSRTFVMDAYEAGPEALINSSEVSVVGGVQQMSYVSGRSSSVYGAGELLRVAPFLVPFSSRAKIFQSWIAAERDAANGGQSFFPTAGRTVHVRRTFIFEDAFQELNRMGAELKATVRVKFIDEHGIEEAGIDGGGMFKEFMYEVMKLGFSPHHYGFFKATPDGHLYPNPDAPVVHENFKVQYAFLGRLLGKAVFDGVLVDIPLARFFVAKILGQFNYPNDLGSLDPELYKNMKFLKNCGPEMVENFGLNFTVANNAFGTAKEVELIPNGKNISVTASNRIEFMHRVANYRMNTQIREQSESFLQGFYEIISSHYIRLFSHAELQLLISGTTGKIDLDDLRRHTRYSGGYTEDTAVINWFWEAMSEMEAEDQSKLLQFVTSSPRAPLLGFSYLVPGFCIHRAEGEVRLPTASTCMNLLKLPNYPSLDVVRDKLRYALQSNAGFDLS